MEANQKRVPFRLQGVEVYRDIRCSAPKMVPDADEKLLSEYRQHMLRMFRSTRLPAVIYKGCTIPSRELGEPIAA
jgi:hypothetical protein